MVKRILLISGFICLMTLGSSLRAGEVRSSEPSIFLNPTSLNVGELVPPKSVIRSIVVKNFGDSSLYISKIKFT